MISQICESYHCLPTRALWELDHDPDRLALRILPFRAYAEMKARIDAVSRNEHAKPDDMPDGPLADLVLDIEAAIVNEQAQAAIAKRLAALEAEPDEE